MNSKPDRRSSAFTLVELLTVIGIIAILAALLLPVLSRSQMRAKRIWCESNLRQAGIAFQSFAHDHNSRFPMAVPGDDGGSLEFAQNGYLVNGPFYFAFRHFQPLANILVTPKILICPADSRLAAANFAALQNANVSYFVGLGADYNKPVSILAGDGNLVTSPQSPTILRAAAGVRLQWTGSQHQFKGNVLFADGHVEEQGNLSPGIASAGDFVLPSISSMANAAGSDSISAGSSPGFNPVNLDSGKGGARPAAAPARSPGSPQDFPPVAQAGNQTAGGKFVSAQIQVEFSNGVVAKTSVPTNAPRSGVAMADDDAGLSPFDRQLARFLRSLIGWGYLLLLLLFLLFLALEIWRRMRKNDRHDRRR